MVWFSGGHDGGNQEATRVDEPDGAMVQPLAEPRTGSAGRGTGQPAFAVTRDMGFDPSSNTELLDVATAAAIPA